MATTEPLRLPSAWRATSCTSLRNVSLRLPVWSWSTNRSENDRICWFAVLPDSSSLYDASSPVAPKLKLK